MCARNSYVTIDSELSCDVLVIGAGLAGTMAALEASRSGLSVLIASSGPIFSGASFYASTWGLGLVGPNDESDINPFCESIQTHGRYMAQPQLVRTLVEGILPIESELEQLGVVLKKPDKPNETEYIPCFDTTVRRWRGLGREAYKSAMSRALEHNNVSFLPYCELVDLVDDSELIDPLIEHLSRGPLRGAVVRDAKNEEFVFIRARSIIFATGGIAGLFEQSLMGPDVTGRVHAIALAHGATLTNIEFLQFMPTLIHPKAGLVFNEKTFRYLSSNKDTLLQQELLEQRSGYGPFSASFEAREIDFAIARAGTKGVCFSYGSLPNPLPEFVQTYFAWLKAEHNLTLSGHFSLSHYAHAANGGITIESDGATSVLGLYACGEAAGGIHGANRIGGLASAAALVFGRRAGNAASCYAISSSPRRGCTPKLKLVSLEHATTKSARLKKLMSKHASILRNREGLTSIQTSINECLGELLGAHTTNSWAEAKTTIALSQQARTSDAFVAACLARTESRGAHFRSDYPDEDGAPT